MRLAAQDITAQVRVWMHATHPRLGHYEPVDLIDAAAGLDAVMQHLDEVRFGFAA